jgi:hypothetical protein
MVYDEYLSKNSNLQKTNWKIIRVEVAFGTKLVTIRREWRKKDSSNLGESKTLRADELLKFLTKEEK